MFSLKPIYMGSHQNETAGASLLQHLLSLNPSGLIAHAACTHGKEEKE